MTISITCSFIPLHAQTDTSIYNVPEPWRLTQACKPKNWTEVEAVVLHTNYAKITLRFDALAIDANTPVRYKESGCSGAGTSLVAQAGQRIHINLPLQKEYQLFTNNECNEEILVGKFSTRTDYPDVVVTPPLIYDAVTGWSQQPSPPNLYDLIAGLQGVTTQEKTAFLQQFLQLKRLPASFDGIFPSKEDFVLY